MLIQQGYMVQITRWPNNVCRNASVALLMFDKDMNAERNYRELRPARDNYQYVR